MTNWDYINAGRFHVIFGKSTLSVIDLLSDRVFHVEGYDQLESLIAALRTVQEEWDRVHGTDEVC